MIINFLLSQFYEDRSKINEAKEVYEKLIEKYKNDTSTENELMRITTVYVEYQRFLLRNEGLDSARQFFRYIIKNNKCGPQLYISTAKIELENTNTTEIARRVYQAGYAQFPDEPIFLLKYIYI